MIPTGRLGRLGISTTVSCRLLFHLSFSTVFWLTSYYRLLMTFNSSFHPAWLQLAIVAPMWTNNPKSDPCGRPLFLNRIYFRSPDRIEWKFSLFPPLTHSRRNIHHDQSSFPQQQSRNFGPLEGASCIQRRRLPCQFKRKSCPPGADRTWILPRLFSTQRNGHPPTETL